MPKNKKKFISKENAVTFHLVHRSQQDPLVTDETAPQRVLLPVKNKKINVDDEHKYGIFFDDDYNYLQHLKNVDEWQGEWEQTEQKKNKQKPKKVQLPSSVFASRVEESVGMLNKAAPESGLRLDLDPEIVAAMDEDFNFDDPDNELEDNFIELANAEGSDLDGECSDFDEDSNEGAESDERDDTVGSLGGEEFETKSRFTNYSLSSSVIRRNEQLSLLDDRFEKMFEAYEDNEIGALDCDQIEGTLFTNDQRLIKMADDFAAEAETLEDESKAFKKKILSLAEHADDVEDMEEIEVSVAEDKWDCESILSTYSNIYNHPVKIVEPKGPRKIKIDKSGMPVDELEGRNGPKLTAKNLSALDNSGGLTGPRSIISMVSELSNRPKGETPEERRERKQNLREYRRERRKERKANTEAFKDEKIRQEKVMLNLRNNLRGIKIL